MKYVSLPYSSIVGRVSILQQLPRGEHGQGTDVVAYFHVTGL